MIKMSKLCILLCTSLLIVLACTVQAALPQKSERYTPTQDNSGRYNPGRNDNYYNSRYYKNREYNNNRRYYDNFFKKYNPAVQAIEARIIESVNSPHRDDGTYNYKYETENGIHAEESGFAVKTAGAEEPNQHVEGSYSYITPEGLRVGVKYTADENGFHPVITYDGVSAEEYARLQQPAGVVITKIN